MRHHFDLTPELHERLGAIEELLEAESKASVIRSAIQLYEALAKRHSEGARFKIVDRLGIEKDLVIIPLGAPGA